MDRFFRDPETFTRVQVGPLGPYLASYAGQLLAQQDARRSACAQIGLVADFSRWLDRHRVTERELTPRHTEQYLRDRAQQGYRPRRGDTAALDRVLDLLRQMAIIAGPPAPAALTPARRGQAEFDRYLHQERALAPSTRVAYGSVVGRFLTERFATEPVDWSGLGAVDVTGFVRRHAARLQPKTSQLMTTALRAFLRFARQRGEITTDLASAVPSVASWKLATLPRLLPPDQVQRVLARCDTQTAVGRRDLAILLRLARLGLRGGEVAALTVVDIDWRAGRLTIRGKGGRVSPFPLPVDVGTAPAAYVQHGRPTGKSCRRVFMRGLAPAMGFSGQQAVGCVVRRALTRAGINSPRKGAHQFRHSLATQMLRHGASLAEIGELLCHRSPQTTAIYAKVDLAALRTLAVAWPGGRNDPPGTSRPGLSGDAPRARLPVVAHGGSCSAPICRVSRRARSLA